ncbi:hypothetical protein DDE05_59750 [Streptomyces cavourensis]|nr:hypothetical protein DDE05_59750 [Streptomyces cavourensis]
MPRLFRGAEHRILDQLWQTFCGITKQAYDLIADWGKLCLSERDGVRGVALKHALEKLSRTL